MITLIRLSQNKLRRQKEEKNTPPSQASRTDMHPTSQTYKDKGKTLAIDNQVPQTLDQSPIKNLA